MPMENPFRSLRRIIRATREHKAEHKAPCSQDPMRVIPLTNRPLGARLVTSATSALVVGIGPITDLGILLARVELAEPACYLLVNYGIEQGRSQIRVGETLDVTMRLDTHFRQPPQAIEDIVVIGSLHTDFGRDAVTALQYALYYLALGAGRYEVVGSAPSPSPLQLFQPGTVARWLADLRPMIVNVGVFALEPRGAILPARHARAPMVVNRLTAAGAMAPARRATAARAAAAGEGRPRRGGIADAILPATIATDPDGIDRSLAELVARVQRQGFSVDIPPDLAAAPMAGEYTLAWSHGTASALHSDGCCILRAGSTVRGSHRSGIQICLTRKRDRLITAGILRPRRGGDVLDVVRDVALPSLTNAARVVTGSNAPGRCWIPV